MDGTIITQGSFTSTGAAQLIPIRSDVDWMTVFNWTEFALAAGAKTQNHGFRYYWQRGMAANTGLMDYYTTNGAATVGTLATATGFTLYDTSVNNPLGAVATTGYAGANPPVITTGSTAGLVAAQSIVRLSGMAAAPTLCGIDFLVVNLVANTSITLPTLANAVAAGGAGFYRVIPYNPLFYPRNRIVCNVTAAANPTVTTNVPHGFTIGQTVRFVVPAVNGMVELNGLTATVLTTPTVNTFTMSTSTVGFTAFAWPLIAVSPNSIAQVVPVGETANATYANLLDDATLNTGEIGIILAGGLTGPAGSNGDLIYWVAGKSFNM